jgi:hypothetical protein
VQEVTRQAAGLLSCSIAGEGVALLAVHVIQGVPVFQTRPGPSRPRVCDVHSLCARGCLGHQKPSQCAQCSVEAGLMQSISLMCCPTRA